MQHGKDLNWLSAPAFFLIIGMLVINTKKQNSAFPSSGKSENSHFSNYGAKTIISFSLILF